MEREKINKTVDPDNLAENEKKRFYVLSMPESIFSGRPLDVIMRVGSVPQVMEEKHCFERIELYLDERKVERAELSPKNGKLKPCLRWSP